MGSAVIDASARTAGGVESGPAEKFSREECRKIDAYWRACKWTWPWINQALRIKGQWPETRTEQRMAARKGMVR
jgi:hypothetical protein